MCGFQLLLASRYLEPTQREFSKIDDNLELKLFGEINNMGQFNDYYAEQQDDGNDTTAMRVKFMQSLPDHRSDKRSPQQ